MQRSHVIPIPKNADPALDLYSHLKSLFSRVRASRESPALSFSPSQYINHRTFTERLKSLIKKAGLDPALYSGHSFRRGGASYLYSIGGTTLMVQVLGEWSSQIFTRYLSLSIEDRLEAQELIATNINGTIGYVELSDLHHHPRS
jgi:integrase